MPNSESHQEIDFEKEPTRKLDHSFFWGEWQNTDAEGAGMARIVFGDNEGALTMHAFVNGEEGLVNLGDADVKVFAENVDSLEGNKFSANYSFDFMQVRMHGWVKLGVLVIAVFNRYTDDSGRSDFFHREFFHAVDRR